MRGPAVINWEVEYAFGLGGRTGGRNWVLPNARNCHARGISTNHVKHAAHTVGVARIR